MVPGTPPGSETQNARDVPFLLSEIKIKGTVPLFFFLHLQVSGERWGGAGAGHRNRQNSLVFFLFVWLVGWFLLLFQIFFFLAQVKWFLVLGQG